MGYTNKALVAVFLFWIHSAFAYIGFNTDGWDYSEPFDIKCFDEGRGQLGANQCMADTYAEHDKLLTTLYGHLVSELSDADTLRDSQNAWLLYRDVECKLRLSGIDENGSMWPFQVNSCRLDLTIKRIKDLRHLESNIDINGCPVTKQSFR